MSKQTININVPVLARVEGEGALDLSIEDGQITQLNLRIYEPPRYFEKFLEGRNYYDVPDAVARICGICPVAYQMSASHAIESVFNIKTTPWIRQMRRLFYCGEWIQSHSLHIHLLAAPDFLGFNSVLEMSSQYPAEVQRGLKLQSLGNELVALFGQRSVHPVGVKIGGFTKAPPVEKVNDLLAQIKEAKQSAIDLVRWCDSLDLPDDDQDFVCVAMRHSDEYPFNEGRIVSDHGLDIPIDEFETYFNEIHQEHSTALHCLLNDKPYLVGPLARINLNADQLADDVRSLMAELNTSFPSSNMFHSMLARAIEIYQCLLEAESILETYHPDDQPCMTVTPAAGTGFGCSEAPRGILWHRYDIDPQGHITKAIIVPPTSQNQSRIEEDLKNSLIHFGLDKPKQQLQLHAEKVIRNYDPCISCATHFLDLNLTRDSEIETCSEQDLTQKLTCRDLSSTAIVGIGSPSDNDTLGWDVIDILDKHPRVDKLKQAGLVLYKLDRPGLAIHDTIKHYGHVIILDAIKPQYSQQSFIKIDLDTSENPQTRFSSHEIGIIESLLLLKSLQQLPAHIELFGVQRITTEQIDILIDDLESSGSE